MEEEEYTSEDERGEEEETCLYPSLGKKKLISVHIRPHMGNLSDYPFCITPQQIVRSEDFSHVIVVCYFIQVMMLFFVNLKVIPAKSSRAIHVSFTPLTLSGAARKSRCVGFALGFMNLDSEVSCLEHCDSMLHPGKCKQ